MKYLTTTEIGNNKKKQTELDNTKGIEHRSLDSSGK